MPPSDHATISPPDNLLPAQLGIVLVRRPILGHVSATLISLAQRGLLKIAANDDDWLVGTRPRLEARPVASFEKPLLDALPPASESRKFNENTAVDLAPALHKFADGLVKDAVHRGWLRHFHHDQLTRAGEDLAVRSGNFRAALRRASIAGDAEIVVNHLPYALTFGFLTPDSAPAEALPLVRFAKAFVSACSDLPGWERPKPQRLPIPGIPSTDFSRNEWRGMPPGGRSIASMNNNTPGMPWP